MSRFIDRGLDDLTPEQRAVADEIIDGPRGNFSTPWKLLVERPGLAQQMCRIGAYIRYENALPNDLKELVIITTARYWDAEYEWHIHSKLAANEGIPADVIEAVRRNEDPSSVNPDILLVVRAARKLLNDHRLDDATFDALVERFGREGTLDLAGTVGYYGLMAQMLNAFDVPVPEGAPKPFS